MIAFARSVRAFLRFLFTGWICMLDRAADFAFKACGGSWRDDGPQRVGTVSGCGCTRSCKPFPGLPHVRPIMKDHTEDHRRPCRI